MPSVRRRVSLELVFYYVGIHCGWYMIVIVFLLTPQSALWVCVFDAPECTLGVRM
jgi:hypothetical protein